MVKPPTTPTYQPASLTVDQINRAIPRIEKRIDDLKKLDLSQIHDMGRAEIQAIRVSIEQTLEEIFGAYSTEYRRYSSAAILSGGPISIGGGRIDHRPYYENSRLAAITLLGHAVQSLAERKGWSVQEIERWMSPVLAYEPGASE